MTNMYSDMEPKYFWFLDGIYLNQPQYTALANCVSSSGTAALTMMSKFLCLNKLINGVLIDAVHLILSLDVGCFGTNGTPQEN